MFRSKVKVDLIYHFRKSDHNALSYTHKERNSKSFYPIANLSYASCHNKHVPTSITFQGKKRAGNRAEEEKSIH